MNSGIKDITTMREDALSIFNAGLSAVNAGNLVKKLCGIDGGNLIVGKKAYLLDRCKNIYVIGAGKATASMAKAIEDILGDRITSGFINVKYGHTADLKYIKINEAGHPVPDENGLNGAGRILEIAQNATASDLIICLLTGGASALMPCPADGISFKDTQDTADLLLKCGATIDEINTIRKHISAIKGGELARAASPATVLTLILSDVVGDKLDVIASGPTVPDSSVFMDCKKIFQKYDLGKKLPETVLRRLKAGRMGDIPDTPKRRDPIFKNVHNVIIGNNEDALTAAKQKADSLGYRSIDLTPKVEEYGSTDESRDLAYLYSVLIREFVIPDGRSISPTCILLGGETIVTIQGKGLGGRNQEFVLAAAIEIADCDRIVVLSADTDGTDGPTNAAGAIADHNTIKRAESLGMDAKAYLDNNDSYRFFKPLNDLIITGATNTNVMDLRIFLIARE